MSVSTSALPRAGTVVAFAAYRSYPAAKALPRVGSRAFSDSFLTSRGGAWSSFGTGAVPLSALLPSFAVLAIVVVASVVLTLFAGGEVGGEVTVVVVEMGSLVIVCSTALVLCLSRQKKM
ncbi:hypothetical protein DL766_008855 [Monosporascus sp. MC13-8B]|uniref:Uncharacterized protein n=1 Tax=Monosporascus cannonballus TaxID=155416 RepID=A0ABY0GQS9_9PEZI|nr:hypothetical protein DL762_010475 [Monosporascus cannonballus]RYP17685.1 hypothetical protein DL766_008855 [Monosporascus sp. MC13-8B]